MITQIDIGLNIRGKKNQIMLMSAKKYKRNFIKNRYLYGKSADISKPDGQNFFFCFQSNCYKISFKYMKYEVCSINGS